MGPVSGQSDDLSIPAVNGEFVGGSILRPGGIAVRGTSPFGVGVQGDGELGVGVQGNSAQLGVQGTSGGGIGVQGVGAGTGVKGVSEKGVGVNGATNADDQSAIFGFNGGRGQVPEGLDRPAGGGVWGHTTVEKGSGVIGSVEPGLTQAAGITGIGPIAGHFFGDVLVTGDVKLVGGDCAEDFDLVESEAAEPGTVMVIDEDGALRRGWRAYDRRVAGVVCGAGDHRPGIILDRRDGAPRRLPVALVGKVNCRVDAEYGSIEVGDLLTTSATPGHAMKASDPGNAFGAVIGKALRRWERGHGLIPILVSLQ